MRGPCERQMQVRPRAWGKEWGGEGRAVQPGTVEGRERGAGAVGGRFRLEGILRRSRLLVVSRGTGPPVPR